MVLPLFSGDKGVEVSKCIENAKSWKKINLSCRKRMTGPGRGRKRMTRGYQNVIYHEIDLANFHKIWNIFVTPKIISSGIRPNTTILIFENS